MRFWSNFYSNRTKVPYLTIWRGTRIAFWHLIIIFEDKTKWIKNVFSMQLLHVFWKPWNTFWDQKIRFCVVVKNKFWKTWLFHFVQIDSKWEEEITQEDHNAGRKLRKILKFLKISKILQRASLSFSSLSLKVIELKNNGQVTQN